MAESFNLVLHIIAGLGFIVLIFWVVRLQKRIKLQKSVIRAFRTPHANEKISGSFRVLLNHVCKTLDIRFLCEKQVSDACVLSLGVWIHKITNHGWESCEIKASRKKILLLVKSKKKSSLEKLQNAVKFIGPTEFQVQYIEEIKK